MQVERKTMLQVLPEKWAIQRTSDNYKIVNEWANDNLKGNYIIDVGYVHSHSIGSFNQVSGYLHKEHTEITTEEFKHLVLGQKLLVTDLKENECIHVSTEEEDRQIRELLHEAGRKWCNNRAYNDSYNNPWKSYGVNGIYLVADNMQADVNYAKEHNYTIYPASWFITTNNTTMNKEIIGYVLKPEYEKYTKAAEKIAGVSKWPSSGSYNFAIGSGIHNDMEKAGVLELWFQEVYAPEKPKYSIGDYVTVLEKYDNYLLNETFKIENTFNGNNNPSTKYVRKPGEVCGIEETKVRPATTQEITNATTKVLTLGDKKTKITIRKGSIEAEGKTVKITRLEGLIKALETIHNVSEWSVTIPSVKIGCCTFTKEEIDQIISTYDNLNK